MGIQLYQFNRTRKSKRRTQFNNAGLQHKAQYQYTRSARYDSPTQKMEFTLQKKGHFNKNELFKANFSSNYF